MYLYELKTLDEKKMFFGQILQIGCFITKELLSVHKLLSNMPITLLILITYFHNFHAI